MSEDKSIMPMVVKHGWGRDALPLPSVDYRAKYETLKEFVRGKWKGECSECASLANEIFIRESQEQRSNKSEVTE